MNFGLSISKLSLLLFVPLIVNANLNDRVTAKQVKELQEQEITQSLVKRLGYSILGAATLVGIGRSGIGFINSSGLSTSLQCAAIPTFVAAVLPGKERASMAKIALKTPLYGALGSLICTKFVNDGLQKINLFGINEIAKGLANVTPAQGAGLFITFALAYNMAKIGFDRAADTTYDFATKTYSEIVSDDQV